MSFHAKYEGTCGDCGTPILRNQEVTYAGPLGVCHVTCPDAASVCPKCHMQIPAAVKECPDCD